MNRYSVTVGNIGTVYDGPSAKEAHAVFSDYREQSWDLPGSRAYGESVTMFEDEGKGNISILRELIGHLDGEGVEYKVINVGAETNEIGEFVVGSAHYTGRSVYLREHNTPEHIVKILYDEGFITSSSMKVYSFDEHELMERDLITLYGRPKRGRQRIPIFQLERAASRWSPPPSIIDDQEFLDTEGENDRRQGRLET